MIAHKPIIKQVGIDNWWFRCEMVMSLLPSFSPKPVLHLRYSNTALKQQWHTVTTPTCDVCILYRQLQLISDFTGLFIIDIHNDLDFLNLMKSH